MERYTLSVLVENNPGVLSRVVGLFSRRGFNIHSLSVGTTQDPQVSRITIEVNGDAQIVEQVSKQLSKIMEVIKIKTLRDSEIVKRGLSLVKVKVTPKTRSEVYAEGQKWRGQGDVHFRRSRSPCPECDSFKRL